MEHVPGLAISQTCVSLYVHAESVAIVLDTTKKSTFSAAVDKDVTSEDEVGRENKQKGLKHTNGKVTTTAKNAEFKSTYSVSVFGVGTYASLSLSLVIWECR